MDVMEEMPSLAQKLGLRVKETHSVMVQTVPHGSPAHAAGFDCRRATFLGFRKMAGFDAQQGHLESVGVALHDHGAQFRLGGEMVVDAGLADAHDLGHVVEREAVVSDGLDEALARIDTGEFVGAEALVRWRHPKLGTLLPRVFLPVMNKSAVLATMLVDYTVGAGKTAKKMQATLTLPAWPPWRWSWVWRSTPTC